MLLLQGQGCGVDVESVENLIRRHEEMEREARVIQERGTVSRLDSCYSKNMCIHINQCTVGSTSLLCGYRLFRKTLSAFQFINCWTYKSL